MLVSNLEIVRSVPLPSHRLLTSLTLTLVVSDVVLNFGEALRPGTPLDEDEIAPKSNAQVNSVALPFRKHFLNDLVVENHREMVVGLAHLSTVPDEVNQVRDGRNRARANAHAIRHELVCIWRLERCILLLLLRRFSGSLLALATF